MVSVRHPLLEIDGSHIGRGCPTYVVAELSANHNQSLEDAVALVTAAKEAGADAVKLQTYTPDTMTLDVDSPLFRRADRGFMPGSTLHELFSVAYTPWEWQPELKRLADSIGLTLFSTPFDKTAVDFLESMDVPAYKIASFEIVDLPLIEYASKKGKPVIISTGMATLSEIDEAVRSARQAGAVQIALLQCTSGYPALPEDMRLSNIPHISAAFGLPVGLSDHSTGIAAPVAAVALGACIIEKHFTLSRDVPGPDTAFSLEPDEFRTMVEAVRTAEKAIGEVDYEVTGDQARLRVFRRSLFVVKDMRAGETFTAENVRCIRPGHGLHPRYMNDVLGRHAATPIKQGTPLRWELVG